MARTRRRLAASLLLKLSIVAAVVVGQIASGPGIFTMRRAQYYTNLSNAWTLLLAFAMMGWEVYAFARGRDANAAPRALLDVRFSLTTGVMVTFVVFNTLLLPYMIREGRAQYLWGLSNAMVHNAVPLLALADWLIFRYGYKPGPRAWAWGLVMPFAYLVFVLGMRLNGYRFGNAIVPYFFLDYTANGWFTLRGKLGTFWWCLFILLFVVAMGKALLRIHRKLEKHAPIEADLPAVPVVAKED